MNENVDQAMRQAVSSGVFPAANLLIGRAGEILHEGFYGNCRTGTCFDIASLTKPICTATLAMQLAHEGLLKLTDTVYQWLGGARQPIHKEITVEHLLNHTPGLPAWRNYYRELPEEVIGTEGGKRWILEAIYKEEIGISPGARCIYSDLGFILLGQLIEEAVQSPLDKLFESRVAKPLGLQNTFFVKNLPFSSPHPLRSTQHAAQKRLAPTEDCPWRGRVIKGEVHDPNAYAMGGVAGHAGLFSTASDIHKFISSQLTYLRGLVPRQPGTYILGWDTPSRQGSAAGRYFSRHSIGHLGYTGCSLWIDLDKDFWVILLTNRIYPTATNEKIKIFRPQIHNLAYREFIESEC